MAKTFDNIFVFGDSFTTPNFCVSAAESFWGQCATHYQSRTIFNFSQPGNSFDSVQQLLIATMPQITLPDSLLLIGIPPLERITVFDNYQNTEYVGYTIDTATWSVEKQEVPAHRGLQCLQHHGNDAVLILHSDRAWLETQTLRQIFLLTQWLDHVEANYVILNLSKDFDADNIWGPSDFVLPYCMSHKNCVLFKDTYHGVNVNVNPPVDFDAFGWNGHHGAAGNKLFFEKSLLPKFQELELC